MRMIHKILLVLTVAFILPVAGLGVSAYLAMESIDEQASEEAVRTLLRSERERIEQLTREKALEIDRALSAYATDVRALKTLFEENLRADRDPTPRRPIDLYPDQDKAGLPGYGYVHPVHGSYADYERRGDSGPWLPRQAVRRLAEDPAFHDRVSALLHHVTQLSSVFRRFHAHHALRPDLIWIVLREGLTNVYPPYDYHEMIRRRPEIVELDENRHDYVRLLNPVHNPQRRIRWLEPYLDPVKGIWMTSCVAPLYEGDRFAGTLGMDILLPAITEQVLALRPGQSGYAFLISSSGKLIATNQEGIADLTWDANHKEALLQTFLRPEEQRWTAERSQALATIRLLDSPSRALAELIEAMCIGHHSVVELKLSGARKVVAYSPIDSAGWALAFVLDEKEIIAAASAIGAVIHRGTEAVLRRFVVFAAFILVILMAAGYLLHRIAVRPVVRLSRSVSALSWDKLDLQGEALRRRDEIGQLDARFRDMLGLFSRSRDELSAEKRILAVTLRSIGDGIIATDSQGRITLLNPVAEALTGWSEAEAIGRPSPEVFWVELEESSERAPCPVREVLESGRIVGSGKQVVLVSRDETRRFIASRGAPIRDLDEELTGVILVFRDLSEERRIEEEMIRIQKLGTVQVLAAGIAHDFNNLLSAILGYISLARHDLRGGNTAAVDFLSKAETAVARARDLTLQLLTFTSGGEPTRRPVDLRPLLLDAAGFALRGAISRCRFGLDDELWNVLADAGQIGQVVQNLVLNAAQAMPDGGQIDIRASNRVLRGAPGEGLPPGRYVEVSVSDRGQGIAKENQQRAFGPFYSTKAQGTGLGLADCYSIIKKHEGRIALESVPGQGTTFRFWLPLAEAARPASDAPRDEALRRGQGRVLLMDDQAAVRDVATELLAALGYEAEAVSEGRAALDRYAEAAAEGRPFALVILDLTVPGGMGGQEALERLRVLNPELRAVISSGYSSDPSLYDPGSDGRTLFMKKPYDIRSLGLVLAKLLGRAEDGAA